MMLRIEPLDLLSHEFYGELARTAQNIGYGWAEYVYRDADGAWAQQGRLVWPWGAEYDAETLAASHSTFE